MAFSTPQQIARKLCEPTEKYHLVVIGDSLLTSKTRPVLTYMSAVKWTGTNFGLNTLSNSAHTSSMGTLDPNRACPSPFIGGRQTWWFPSGGVEARFTGATEPSNGQNSTQTRVAYPTSNVSSVNCPLLWSRLQTANAVARSKCVYYKHPGAMAGAPGFRIVWNHADAIQYTDPNCYQGPFIYDMTGEGYGATEVVLPSTYPWAETPGLGTFFNAKNATAGVNLQTLSIGAATIELDGPGIVYFSLAQGGWKVSGWLDDAEVPVALFSTLLPMIAPKPIFWLDLGTNGSPGVNTPAQHAAGMIELINRKLRAGDPYADIILTSAHENYASGSNPIYREGGYIIADTLPGVLYLDTLAALPTYAEGVLLGLYGDDIHYLPRGDDFKFPVINRMIAQAAYPGQLVETFGSLHESIVGVGTSFGHLDETWGTLEERIKAQRRHFRAPPERTVILK